MNTLNNELRRKRLFAWVSEDLHKQAKLDAVSNDVKLDDWVRDAVEQKLKQQSRKRESPSVSLTHSEESTK